MEAMLHAGMGLALALTALSDNAPGWALKRATREMGARVFGQASWSEALSAYPTLFSAMTVAVISAAEKSGGLEGACRTLANYAEREYEIQQEIKRDTWYAKILLCISIVLAGAAPITISVGDFVWVLGVKEQVVIFGGAWLLWKAANYLWPVGARGGTVRQWIDTQRLKLPIAGRTVRAFAVAKFCRVLGLSYSAGLSLPQSVELAADSCGNAVLMAKLRQTSPAMRGGKTLTEALTATYELPPMSLPMIRNGEATGDLDPQLQAAARFLETDAETALQQSTKLLCVVIFLLTALKIGVAVYQYWKGYAGIS